MYERFLIQSHVASDFCGSFGVKQHFLFPPFNLPAQRDLSGNHASVKPTFLRKFKCWGRGRGSVGGGDRCAWRLMIMSPAIELGGV